MIVLTILRPNDSIRILYLFASPKMFLEAMGFRKMVEKG